MHENPRREELLRQIVVGAGGDENVRQFYINAPTSELEAIISKAKQVSAAAIMTPASSDEPGGHAERLRCLATMSSESPAQTYETAALAILSRAVQSGYEIIDFPMSGGSEETSLWPSSDSPMENTRPVTREPPGYHPAGHPKSVFRPISQLPLDRFSGAEAYWGPDVLVRVPPSTHYPHTFTWFVANKDRHEWFATDPSTKLQQQPLHGKPDAWMPIPGMFLLPTWWRQTDPPRPASVERWFPPRVEDPRIDRRVAAAFLPMAEYPRHYRPRRESHFGPAVLLRVPASNYPFGFVCHVAHLDADRWVARCPHEPACIAWLQVEPDAWMPIPGVSLDPARPVSEKPNLLRISPQQYHRLREAASVSTNIFQDERWVRIMADDFSDGVWDKDGHGHSAAALPIPRRLQFRLAAWAASYEALTPFYDSRISPADLTRLSEEGLQIARAIKQALPDWTVLYHHPEKAARREAGVQDYLMTIT